jgi:hypothetical protein
LINKEITYVGAISSKLLQINDEPTDNQKIKQNGQLESLYTNLKILFFVFNDFSNKKSGKYLSG